MTYNNPAGVFPILILYIYNNYYLIINLLIGRELLDIQVVRAGFFRYNQHQVLLALSIPKLTRPYADSCL